MKNDIITWFEHTFPDLVTLMEATTHDHSDGTQNPYHLEGDIWTHTLMVVDTLASEDPDLILAALLHDVGKLYTRKERQGGRVSFREHENVSMVKSVDILQQLPPTLTVDRLKILQFVAWHGQLWHPKNDHDENALINRRFGHDVDFYRDFITFVRADAFGRSVCNEHEVIALMERFAYYENYIPFPVNAYPQHQPDKEVLFLIGLSGSGKTTWHRNHRPLEAHAVISVDDILTRGKLDYNSIDYAKAVKKAHAQTLQEIRQHVDRRRDVVVDMTNLSREARRKKLSLFPTTQYRRKAVVFLPGEAQQNRFLASRPGKKIPPEVLERQKIVFELPGLDEFESIDYRLP